MLACDVPMSLSVERVRALMPREGCSEQANVASMCSPIDISRVVWKVGAIACFRMHGPGTE